MPMREAGAPGIGCQAAEVSLIPDFGRTPSPARTSPPSAFTIFVLVWTVI
jgi:hypothetical protein